MHLNKIKYKREAQEKNTICKYEKVYVIICSVK